MGVEEKIGVLLDLQISSSFSCWVVHTDEAFIILQVGRDTALITLLLMGL